MKRVRPGTAVIRVADAQHEGMQGDCVQQSLARKRTCSTDICGSLMDLPHQAAASSPPTSADSPSAPSPPDATRSADHAATFSASATPCQQAAEDGVSQQATELAQSWRDTSAMVVIMHQAHLSEQRALHTAAVYGAENTCLRGENLAFKKRCGSLEVRAKPWVIRYPPLLRQCLWIWPPICAEAILCTTLGTQPVIIVLLTRGLMTCGGNV